MATPADSHGHALAGPHPDGFLAHQFDSSAQQREAAKLGMWLFLATEALLFGGLFCLYAVFRANHPEIFAYGAQFLDTGWGALNTVVLIVSSLTMAIAVRCAQCGQQRGLVIFLVLTLICATDFLGIKAIEYAHKFHDNLVWGMRFYEPPHGLVFGQHATEPAALDVVQLAPGNADIGRGFFRNTCAGCHGTRGEGLPNSGKPLNASQFVSGLDDNGLLAFLLKGRMPSDPLNTTGIAMLPRGGNPLLTDQDLLHVIAYVRVLQSRPGRQPGQQPGETKPLEQTGVPAAAPEDLLITRSFIPDAARGPSGLAPEAVESLAEDRSSTRAEHPDPRTDADRPDNAHLFFGVYFLMTGLHGLHVLIGMFVITWLLVRAYRGDFSRRYFTPVDLGGLYWHVVDVIWIFLFPMLYLIR